MSAPFQPVSVAHCSAVTLTSYHPVPAPLPCQVEICDVDRVRSQKRSAATNVTNRQSECMNNCATLDKSRMWHSRHSMSDAWHFTSDVHPCVRDTQLSHHRPLGRADESLLKTLVVFHECETNQPRVSSLHVETLVTPRERNNPPPDSMPRVQGLHFPFTTCQSQTTTAVSQR